MLHICSLILYAHMCMCMHMRGFPLSVFLFNSCPLLTKICSELHLTCSSQPVGTVFSFSSLY